MVARLSRQTLLQILDYIPDGVVVLDNAANYMVVNRAYEKLVGITGRDIIGHNTQELVEKGYISAPSLAQLIIQTRRRTSIVQRMQKTGKELLLTGSPILDAEGNISFIVGILRDITELNKLKQELGVRYREFQRYQAELELLRRERVVEKVIHRSKTMSQVIEVVKRIAPFDTTVLLTGESGVGKEVMARLIHDLSPRANEPFVEVNSAAIPAELIEAELFGYEEGAFTGAKKKGKPGLFEVANKGTLFLDEVAELSPKTQANLLRVLQDGKVRRVGGTTSFEVDTRIIAATNKNLLELVQKGSFREDLFYRLNVVPITIPPLRQRKEDIAPLAAHFVAKFNAKHGLNKSFSPEVLQYFCHYDWPGNVRELEHTVERLLLTSSDTEVTLASLAQQNPGGIIDFQFMSLQEYLNSMERQLLENLYRSLQSTRKVAQILQVDQSTVVRKLQKYGISKEKTQEEE